MADEDLTGADPARHVVVQRLDGFPATLRRLEDGTLVLEGRDGAPLPHLAPGERLRVTRPVVGDATYAQSARVLRVEEGQRADIRTSEETVREQQRQHVRVSTRSLDVLLVEKGTALGVQAELRDVSAGGVRAVIDGDTFDVGDTLRVRLELPRSPKSPLELDLTGEVVWLGPLKDGRAAAGIEFGPTDSATESELMRWVFKQQSKRG